MSPAVLMMKPEPAAWLEPWPNGVRLVRAVPAVATVISTTLAVDAFAMSEMVSACERASLTGRAGVASAGVEAAIGAATLLVPPPERSA